ncbi:MAG: hypothetical protein B6I22_03595 [Desulfobacteraceae bacterium 4572_123]|nr:MAG: hypothetical protein B6I22_03595 [Desulfobacteraceae bacterium 4572_123]
MPRPAWQTTLKSPFISEKNLHHSVLYTERHIAGNTKKDLIVSFDWNQLTAQYSNFKKERITVPAGTFDTYLIEPELKDVGGVFKKSKNAKIQLWITADRRRIPVKIKSKVIVGNFTGELVTAE